jgi:hypothetical protein
MEPKMRRLLQGEALERRARELGVDIEGGPITQSVSGKQERADDSELQRRVLEAERSVRESRLWRSALVSAIASMVSAAVALAATFWHH